MAHDVFISYSSKDKATADAVCARLEAHGIRCWISSRDVRPGFAYGEEIIEAIEGCRVMVLVFSSSANASVHIPKEIERAVSHGIPIVPLRVESVTPGKSLDYFISSIHWLDAITPPLQQHLESLAATIQAVLQQRIKEAAPESEAKTLSAVAPGPREKAPSPLAAERKRKLAYIALAAAVLSAIAVVMGIKLSASDPLVGCWRWFNNVPVAIYADGTLSAGPFTGHWQSTDPARHEYQLTWPEIEDQLSLSANGAILQGGNQYGIFTSAKRLSPGAGVVADWRWPNGVTVSVSADGTFGAGRLKGAWRMVDATGRIYRLTWPNPIDTLTLSPDFQRLAGSDQYGVLISGTKIGIKCN